MTYIANFATQQWNIANSILLRLIEILPSITRIVKQKAHFTEKLTSQRISLKHFYLLIFLYGKYVIRNLKIFESIGHPLPAEETCKLHIDELYHKEIFSIRDYVQDQPIFLIVDETEISGTKYVKNDLLFKCWPLSYSANANIVLQILDDAIKLLHISRSNFNLLLSASYIIFNGKTWHLLYPNLFHVTCVAHLTHNCAIQVRSKYHDVDQLIVRVKMLLLKTNRVPMILLIYRNLQIQS